MDCNVLRVHEINFHRLDMRTRFPFRYGIASMSGLPHLLVQSEVKHDGQHCKGISADGLPPKWFTKNPETTFEADDLPGMLRVIRQAADTAIEIGPQPSLFAWWQQLYRAQHAWARDAAIPPLLASFGVSLIERAVIDAVCRGCETTFYDALESNLFQIELGSVRPGLESFSPADVLVSSDTILLRHTVGLGDPLVDDDIPEAERTHDGLPHSLASNIRRYQLEYFKMKLSGQLQHDQKRLVDIANVLSAEVGRKAKFTLDGNEQFQSMGEFRAAWESFLAIDALRDLIEHGLVFVEQPLHRDVALVDSVGDELDNWPDAPPIIIDESDAELDSLPKALRLGYRGTSHKNCKGVIKSIAAAATIAQQSTQSRQLILSGEDLANVGPVALLQDLAVASALGIPHVERNGHHYFAGLSMFPKSIQDQMVQDHGDLYHWSEQGFASLDARTRLRVTSVMRAPFGVARLPDLSPIPAWDF